MSKKETFDKIFDALLDEALDTIESQPDVHLPEEMEVTFSEKHEERMQRLFAKERAKAKRKKVFRHIQRMAACFLVLILVSGITVMSVDAFRVRFLNFVFDTQEIKTRINLVEEGTQYTSDEVILEYVPVGFTLDKKEIEEKKIYLKFRNESEYFSILINDVDMIRSIDTEGAKCETLTINDNEAMYSENANIKILTMHDDRYIYTISGSVNRNEIIKIAQNIKKY